MRLISWSMLTAAFVCLIVASSGAAAEMYDETTAPGDVSLMYPEHNFIDPGHQGSLPETNDVEGLLLYKMFTSMRNQDLLSNILAGPKWISTGTVLVPTETFENLAMLKDSMMKRVSDANSNVAKTTKVAKPVPKWKNKKGTRRTSMICYFKLCALRPPTK